MNMPAFRTAVVVLGTVVLFLIGLLTLSGCEPSKEQQAVDAYNRGVDFYDKGESDKAIADYTEAIRLDPKLVDAYNGRGNAYLTKGEYDRAIADYTKAISLNPEYAKAYCKRGWPARSRTAAIWYSRTARYRKGVDRSIETMLEELSQIHEVAVVYPPKAKGDQPLIEMTTFHP